MASVLRRPFPRVAFVIHIALSSTSVLADVSFPSNPQTSAECEEPAKQMQAMADREHELGQQLSKQSDAIPYGIECARDEQCRADYYVRHHQLYELTIAHFRERDRLTKERRDLEKACRAAAKLNEQRAAEGKDETNSILARYRELKEGYEEAKHAYEMAKDLYMKRPAELAEDAGNRAAARLADGTIDSAYRRRNDAYSAELEKAMNAAKRKTVDLVRRSEVIAAIQGASFNELKSQVHQLYGDVNQLESDIGSWRMLPSPDEPTVALARPRANGAAVMFQQALDQAQQQERERQRLISDARERARVAAIAEEQARLQREKERLAALAEVPRPASVASPVGPARYGTGTNPTPNQLIAFCEVEWNRSTDNGYYDIAGSYFVSDALKATSEALRSGAWLTDFRRGRLGGSQAFADCLSRGVLAGRNGTFRTPSMRVKARIDGDERGRQDP